MALHVRFFPFSKPLRRSEVVGKVRLLSYAALLLVVLSAPVWGPRALRHLSWFDVERVEISGTRLLAPHEVLAASGVRRGQSVWDDAGEWEAALRSHPVVSDAQVSRKLLRTLRIRVEEQRPVALVEMGTLRPVTASGAILPIDPARAPVDLPLIRVPATSPRLDVSTDTATLALLAETARLGQLDPGLVGRISEVRQGKAGELLLTLSHPAAELVLPPGAESVRLRHLRAVLEDIERRGDTSGMDAGGASAPRVDLRFVDQVVVRYPLDRSLKRSAH
jgi:cell division protein FtsQ